MLVVVSGMAFEARLAQGRDIATCYGLDSAILTADIEQAVRQGARGILSFGTAAGLSPKLSAGAVIVGRRIIAGPEVFTADNAWARQLRIILTNALHADIAGVDQPIATVAEKSALYAASGAAVADMESHQAARLAERHHLPFAALRVVLDGAGRALPTAAFAAAKPDGTLDYGGFAKSLFTSPEQLPEVMRLIWDNNRAEQALRRSCYLLKGSLFALNLC